MPHIVQCKYLKHVTHLIHLGRYVLYVLWMCFDYLFRLCFVLRLRIESFTFLLDYLVFGISHIKAIRPKAKVICEMCRDELRVCYLKIHRKVSMSLKQLILLY